MTTTFETPAPKPDKVMQDAFNQLADRLEMRELTARGLDLLERLEATDEDAEALAEAIEFIRRYDEDKA
jgi:flagellar biosynthesis regulator FlaF